VEEKVLKPFSGNNTVIYVSLIAWRPVIYPIIHEGKSFCIQCTLFPKEHSFCKVSRLSLFVRLVRASLDADEYGVFLAG